MSRLIEIVIVAYFLAYAENSSASETNLTKANSKLPTKYFYIFFSNGQIRTYLSTVVQKEMKHKLKTVNFPCHLPWKKIILSLAEKVKNLTSVLVFRNKWRSNPFDNQILMRAIITRGLYTFYPLFEVHLCTVNFGLMYG